MKAFLIGIAIVGVLTPPLIRPASAQEVDAKCKDVYDKVACGCALQNGGRVIPPAVGVKREGLKLRPREGSTQTLDGGQVAFPKYFRRDGLKVHKSRALEGYLACMRLNGRK
ncbi:MAG TPA: hypothetical protein VLU23_17100 [Pseudolabrys sp.]|jgi:hypothetical protein|nr:hypothetical protein [Pseudolabrys sp.]